MVFIESMLVMVYVVFLYVYHVFKGRLLSLMLKIIRFSERDAFFFRVSFITNLGHDDETYSVFITGQLGKQEGKAQ